MLGRKLVVVLKGRAEGEEGRRNAYQSEVEAGRKTRMTIG